MNFLAFCRDKLTAESGFTLLEILLVITISSLLMVVFLQLLSSLYQNNDFFNLQNSWQLDGYLAVDFIASQVKNAAAVEVINQQELNIFSYYDQEYQWLKFSVYQSGQHKALGRAIGSSNPDSRDFGRNLSLLDRIDSLEFEIIDESLLRITLFLENDQNKLTISRLIKI